MEEFYKELFEEIEKRNLNSVDSVLKLRRELCRKYNPNVFPSIIHILTNASPEQFEKLKFLVTKPMRTNSGVTPIALMTKPVNCPHGKCTICPGGIGSPFGDMPQSYTGAEPSTMRAIRNDYDPYLIVFNRIEQFVLLNQSVDKVELIIQGGTFPAMTKEYQDMYIKYAFKAMNDFGEMFFNNDKLDLKKFKEFFELPVYELKQDRTDRIKDKIRKLKGECSLEKEHKRNESVKIRCVGLTIETRPDWGILEHGNVMLEQGCTRVELGLQSTSDKVLKRIARGHTIEQSKKSLQVLKDLGFKINGHVMIGLPEQGKDELFEFFSDEDFRPDMIKIYPCMVMKGTVLEQEYNKGKFEPMMTKEAVKVIAEFKTRIPKYVRIMRVQRDIPTKQSVSGVDKTNLRQLVFNYMKEQSMKCNCIRCNEVKEIKNPELKVIEYNSSNGKEFFIYFAQDEEIVGFCRLRFPSEFLREEITSTSAIVRELHVYGQAIDINKEGEVQHLGFGKKLMLKAEEICKENNKNKLLVISGVGVRGYYKKLGYVQDGPYVSKDL
ncbi:MAG: tRNA uridine(34) 5-carboxymethylaminomethyl modification radical SAM/GNAT enzyme Elp3 [Nanoarchaeota archaeon]|nr:tRNA uridine(34) 5-carboxymethylaminomethyl modification radical SAM/GNAT enzyme Elp3 [Nanoarchaeota archaeon]